jgi:hypothetical protein
MHVTYYNVSGLVNVAVTRVGFTRVTMPQFTEYDWQPHEQPFTVWPCESKPRVESEPVTLLVPLAFGAFWTGVSLIAGYLVLYHSETIRATEGLASMFD